MTSVGMNLAAVNYFATEFPFIDRMKTANNWSASSGVVPVDAHGNPTAIPAGSNYILTLVGLDPVSAPMTDVYELSWGGTGTFQVAGAKIISSQPGKLVFQYTNAASTMANVVIYSINPSDPVHDIHVVRQDQAADFAQGRIFNSDFLSQVSNWQALRFMDWENTNVTTISAWDQRTHVDDRTWAQNGNSSGVPIEVMIKLANEARTDLWFNVPTQADDTYVRNALQLIKDQLAPGLKVHVEYSNEVWNTGFQQNRYAQTMANKLWGVDANHDGVIDPNNSSEAVARGDQVYYGYRAAQIAAIANSVFSGIDDSRLEMVLATQTGNGGLEQYFLNGISRAAAGSIGALFDELATGDYFGLELSGYTSADQAKVIEWAKAGEAGLAAAFNELAHGGAGLSIKYSVDDVAALLKYEKSAADRFGLDLVAYEGGFHGTAQGYGSNQALIQDFFARLMADPRMEDLYKYWFDTFRDAGGKMLAAFDDVQAPSVYGTFGTLASLYDAKTPRYEALLSEATPKDLAPAPTIPNDPTLITTSSNATLDSTHANLTYAGTGDFVGTGNDQANIITGGAGADRLYGAAGDDVLIGGLGADLLDGGAGADRMSGGTGNDIYLVGETGDVVSELAGEGVDQVRTTLAAYSLGANVENLTYLGSGAFIGIGNALDNALVGGAGADRLEGGDGADLLDGAAGADQLVGGLGNDIYLVDNVGDVVTELSSGGVDEVRTTLSAYTLGANVENLAYLGSGNFTARGNALANILTGGSGNDSLDGGLGADRMIGGAGNDSYSVNDAGDLVIEQAGQGTDTVTTSVNYTLAANVENVMLASGATVVHGNDLGNVIREYLGGLGTYMLYGEGGNDMILGSDAIDTMFGGSGADQLSGAGGNDVLNGGLGSDLMIGGTGADRFVFAPGDSSAIRSTADMIKDFSHAEGDRIDLTAFDANPATTAHDALRFIASAGFTHHAGEIRAVGTDLQIDLNGDAIVDFALYLNNAPSLVASDFIL